MPRTSKPTVPELRAELERVRYRLETLRRYEAEVQADLDAAEGRKHDAALSRAIAAGEPYEVTHRLYVIASAHAYLRSGDDLSATMPPRYAAEVRAEMERIRAASTTTTPETTP